MHGIDQAEAFLDTAFAQALLDLGGYVDQFPALRKFEPQLLAIGFHAGSLTRIAFGGEPCERPARLLPALSPPCRFTPTCISIRNTPAQRAAISIFSISHFGRKKRASR